MTPEWEGVCGAADACGRVTVNRPDRRCCMRWDASLGLDAAYDGAPWLTSSALTASPLLTLHLRSVNVRKLQQLFAHSLHISGGESIGRQVPSTLCMHDSNP